MRLKIALLFILSILIPTTLLAYFGLQAVQSERNIVERSVRQRYEAMADVIENEIDTALSGLSKDAINDKSLLEPVLRDQTSLFSDQAAIFDDKGNALGANKGRGQLMVTRRLKELPYTIAVFEPYSFSLESYEKRKKVLYFYVTLIATSVVLILGGGAFTFSALSQQWRLAELKSEFVSGLSHDLRKPLTSIRMFSEMLKYNVVPNEEKKQEYYNVINAESERLTQLANNILDFSLIESGRKRHRFKETDIGKLVRETADYFISYNIGEEHHIALSIQDNLFPIKVDASAVSQALLNLLSNAVKYSPPGKEIKVNVYKKQNGVAIEVADEGIGIPRPEQKKIFRRFYRVRRVASDVEGTGLGLALVKYAAQIHRGRVMVQSEEGKGSKFTLILPV